MSSVSVDALVQKSKALDTRVAELQQNIGSENDYELSTLVKNRSAAVTATTLAKGKRDMDYCKKRFDSVDQGINVSIYPLISLYDFCNINVLFLHSFCYYRMSLQVKILPQIVLLQQGTSETHLQFKQTLPR